MVAVDVERPVVGIRLELDVAPVLIIDTGVHSQAAIEQPRFLTKFVAQDTVRFICGGPLAARIALLLESRCPRRTGGRIDSVAPARTKAARHGCIRHQVRTKRVGQIEFWVETRRREWDETGTRGRRGSVARSPAADAGREAIIVAIY